jgi:AraC-like DNA-binding protein
MLAYLRQDANISSMGASVPTNIANSDGARVDRVALSIGALDLVQLRNYAHAFPRHSHDYYTIGVFADGNGRLAYRGSSWSADEGTVLAVPPDEVHTAEPLADRGWTYRAMYPSAELVALATGRAASPGVPAFFAQPIYHDRVVAQKILDAHVMLLADPPELAAEEALLRALRMLAERHGAGSRPLPIPCASARMVLVARDYLQANFAKPVKLVELATICDASPFHLVRSFRDIIGMPPHAYLTQIRANRARELLCRGETLSGAAYLCGFADQSHLTRTFKRIFGVTPGAYVAGDGSRVGGSHAMRRRPSFRPASN